jgi:hypothetical protein
MVPSAFRTCNFVSSRSALLDFDVLEFLGADLGGTLSEGCGIMKAYDSGMCMAGKSHEMARELYI